MNRIRVVSCLLGVVCAGRAMACDLCSVYSAVEARESGPGWSGTVFEQFTHYGTLQEDGHEVSNPVGQYLDSSITHFIVGYQFNERFGLQLNVPFIYRSFKRPEGFAIDRGTVSGLGDMSLVANVRLYEKLTEDTTILVSGLGGIKFPTGSSHRLKEELNETPPPPGAPESGIHGHDLALGSGSYDGIIGGTALARWKRLFASAGLQYAIRTEGDVHYRYANDLTWNGGPGVYLWMAHEGTLTLQLNVSGETKGKDTFEGDKAEDTAITSLYLGPEVGLTWKRNLSADFGVDIPVSQNNSALQAVADYRIRAAATWRF
jgi:hypothetical protein